jgi:hypothetical protein
LVAGDQRIRIADGVADRGDAGARPKRLAASEFQSQAKSRVDILADSAVVTAAPGHRNRREPIEFIPHPLSLGPVQEFIAGHTRRAANDVHGQNPSRRS